MQELADAYSRVVATLANPAFEAGCSTAWALDYAQNGGVRVVMLTSAALTHLPDYNQIMIWLGGPNADVGATLAAAAPLLPPQEQAAAVALLDSADRCASLAAHAGLRLMLGGAMGIAPRDVRIHHGAHGKPLLDRGDLHFSLSHVRGAVAVALARQPIGIDVERKAALPEMDMIAATVFAPESAAALDSVRGAARLDLFYRFWTLGEAFIKATGLGIFQGLDSFAFTPDGEPRLTRVSPPWGPAERWRFGFC